MSAVLDLAPGIYPGVSHADYHARIPGLVSKTVLDLVDRSPATYDAWLKGAERKSTAALEFGSALHMAVLEPEVFLQTYVVAPNFGDCRFKENKAAKARWMAENDGRKPLDADDWRAIHGMFEAIHAHPLAGKMIRDGRPELTLRWKDEETGLECKARTDYFVERHGMVVDLKSTEDARLAAFRRSVANYRYHVQHAHYADGFRAIGAPIKHFVFLAIEKEAPYNLALFNLDHDALTRGYNAARRNMTTLAQCVETGTYPGYPVTIQDLDLPTWAP